MDDGPIVVLHDHLDGGVRPATILELARAQGRPLPADEPESLAEWMTITPALGLEEAFARFDLVTSLLQTREALVRVAVEAVEDVAADGVIHAEFRFAPLLHTQSGLDATGVVEAVEEGLTRASADARIDARLILCAMRDQPEEASAAVARLAASRAADGVVVGMDLAGLEPGHPAADHARAFELAHHAGLGITVHAGEMDGPHQVASALDTCRPNRIGHGWRLIDECDVEDGRVTRLGPTAQRIRDQGIPLEICLTSNACLGTEVTDHPLRLLRDAGLRVTLNPDDRTITTTSPSRELGLARLHHGFDRADLAACVAQAALSCFLPDREREALLERVHDGWAAVPTHLVHLADLDRWRETRGEHYEPSEYGADGFIHLSAPRQVLAPANRFYRGRRDLVALVVDATRLDEHLVWEAGTDTIERFPHLYAPLPRRAVIDEVPFAPEPDGSFLLPPVLSHLR